MKFSMDGTSMMNRHNRRGCGPPSSAPMRATRITSLSGLVVEQGARCTRLDGGSEPRISVPNRLARLPAQLLMMMLLISASASCPARGSAAPGYRAAEHALDDLSRLPCPAKRSRVGLNPPPHRTAGRSGTGDARGTRLAPFQALGQLVAERISMVGTASLISSWTMAEKAAAASPRERLKASVKASISSFGKSAAWP